MEGCSVGVSSIPALSAAVTAELRVFAGSGRNSRFSMNRKKQFASERLLVLARALASSLQLADTSVRKNF